MKRLLLNALFFIMCTFVCAQINKVNNVNIASLQVIAGNDWLGLPIIKLGDKEVINVSFDELSHDYKRYTYSVTHCEADWSITENLFTSDYIKGFQNEIMLDNYEESINTNTLYTHYTLSVPNENIQLLMSGNYRIDIIDDDSKDTIITSYFMVYEPEASVYLDNLTDTDIDTRKGHQQLNLIVNYPLSLNVTDARKQFKVAVVQNNNLSNLVWCPNAPIVRQGAVEWNHAKDLIFPAGNEFHKFEILDPHRNSMGVDFIDWDGELNHIHLFHDYPRRAYVYDEDANGSFYIRNSDNLENDITCDYVLVHFYLDTPPLDGDVFVDGRWVNDNLKKYCKMKYDDKNKCYQAAIPLKYGYYNYQYLLCSQETDRNYNKSLTEYTEGDFYQTENKYAAFVYFRANTDRTWRLIGVGKSR